MCAPQHLCAHRAMHTDTCVHTEPCTLTHVYTCVCTESRAHRAMHTDTCVHLCVHTELCTLTRVCSCVHTDPGTLTHTHRVTDTGTACADTHTGTALPQSPPGPNPLHGSLLLAWVPPQPTQAPAGGQEPGLVVQHHPSQRQRHAGIAQRAQPCAKQQS